MTKFKVPVAAHIFLVQANKVLLIRRRNTGFEDGKYGLVGGHIAGGESVKQAAIRECREEIGVDIVPTDLKFVGVSHYTSPTSEGIDFYFKTSRWSGEPYPRSECDELHWCVVDELPEETIGFVCRAIAHHLQAGECFDLEGWG